MSSVKHQRIYQHIVTEQDEAAFLNDLHTVLSNITTASTRQGATVDWSTLTIQPGEVMEIKSGAGEIVGAYHEPLMVSVDTVWIEEG